MARSGRVQENSRLDSRRPELLAAPSPLAPSLSLPMTLPLFPPWATNTATATTITVAPLTGALEPHSSPLPTAFFPRPIPPAKGAPRALRWGSARARAGRVGGRWRGPRLGMREPSDTERSAAPPDGRAASVRSAPAPPLRSVGGAARSTCVGGGRAPREGRKSAPAQKTWTGAPGIQAQKGISQDKDTDGQVDERRSRQSHKRIKTWLHHPPPTFYLPPHCVPRDHPGLTLHP